MIEIIDCEQNSPEWIAARCGVVTASRFKDILAKGEGRMRTRYLHDLAAEICRGWPEDDGYSNTHMERGHAMEDEARRIYALLTDNEPQRVGFIKDGRIGCSPDSLIGDDGGLEIKSALGHIQIERLKRGALPGEHAAQVQGSMWVTGRAWWDYCSYAADLPPLVLHIKRDEAYIAQLSKAVEAFVEELDSLVASIRTYENFRAAAAAA